MTIFVRVCFFLLLLPSCASLRNAKIVDYYHPNFECAGNLGSRDPDFWTLYQAKYREAIEFYSKENARIKTAQIVFVGNSLMAGFPPGLLQEEFPGSVNRGIPGDMTELLLGRLESTVFPLKPSYIILEIGGNDIREGKCLDYIESKQREIVSRIRTVLPNAKVILLGIPPVLSGQVNSVSPIVNSTLARIAAGSPNLSYLDIWPYFRTKGLPFLREELALEYEGKTDKIHVNENAYKIWAKQIKPLLK